MLREKYSKNDLGLSFAAVTLAMVCYALFSSSIALIFKFDKEYWWTVLQLTLNTLIIGASAFVYAAISRTNVVKATKINQKPPIAHIGWGVLSTLFLIPMMVPLNNWVMEGIAKIGLAKPSVDLELDIVSMIIVACILPAFTEEIVFRGTVAQSLVAEDRRAVACRRKEQIGVSCNSRRAVCVISYESRANDTPICFGRVYGIACVPQRQCLDKRYRAFV